MTGLNFRLPTEAEWEFAARGGNKSKGFIYSGSDDIDKVAVYKDAGNLHYLLVASKMANELGIYDMSGNVMEWCSDWYGEYTDENQINPIGSDFNTENLKVRRNGSGVYGASYQYIAKREGSTINLRRQSSGFRLVL